MVQQPSSCQLQDGASSQILYSVILKGRCQQSEQAGSGESLATDGKKERVKMELKA